MSNSRSLSAYADIRRVLDQIIARGEYPARFRLPDTKKATAWRHRANRFRKLDRDQNAYMSNIPVQFGQSVYDELVFRLENSDVVIDHIGAEGDLIIGDQKIELE